MTFLRAIAGGLVLLAALVVSACGGNGSSSKLDDATVRTFMAKFDAATEARERAAIDVLVAPDFTDKITTPNGSKTMNRADYMEVVGTPNPVNTHRKTQFTIKDVSLDASGTDASVTAHADAEYTAATGEFQGKRVHEIVDYVYKIKLLSGVPLLVSTDATLTSASVDGNKIF